MKARVKKMAASRSRRGKETMQTLKDQTDKYFAIREGVLDSREINAYVINKLARYGVIKVTQDSFEQDCDEALSKWTNPFTIAAPDIDGLTDYVVAHLNAIEDVIGQMARLKYEDRKCKEKYTIQEPVRTTMRIPYGAMGVDL